MLGRITSGSGIIWTVYARTPTCNESTQRFRPSSLGGLTFLRCFFPSGCAAGRAEACSDARSWDRPHSRHQPFRSGPDAYQFKTSSDVGFYFEGAAPSSKVEWGTQAVLQTGQTRVSARSSEKGGEGERVPPCHQEGGSRPARDWARGKRRVSAGRLNVHQGERSSNRWRTSP